MNKFALKRSLTQEDSEKIKKSAIPLNDKQFLLSHLQRQLPAISLSAHSPLVTAIANDEDAEMIFAQQVFGYGLPGDVLIALSTSGNSKNVVRAVTVAKLFGLKVILLPDGKKRGQGERPRLRCPCVRSGRSHLQNSAASPAGISLLVRNGGGGAVFVARIQGFRQRLPWDLCFFCRSVLPHNKR